MIYYHHYYDVFIRTRTSFLFLISCSGRWRFGVIFSYGISFWNTEWNLGRILEWKQLTPVQNYLFQMIYKKSQLPCPLPFLIDHSSNLSTNASDMSGLYALRNNSTQMHFSRTDVSPAVLGSSDAHHSTGVHVEPHPDDEEMCTPKYFIFNSQVRCSRQCWLQVSLWCQFRSFCWLSSCKPLHFSYLFCAPCFVGLISF